jgi:hypothetical protein
VDRVEVSQLLVTKRDPRARKFLPRVAPETLPLTLLPPRDHVVQHIRRFFVPASEAVPCAYKRQEVIRPLGILIRWDVKLAIEFPQGLVFVREKTQ